MNLAFVFMLMIPMDISEINGSDKGEARSLIISKHPFPENHFKMNPRLMRATAQVALEMELLDERELRYYFVKQEEFKTDMQHMQGRYEELKDAPLISHEWKIPNKDFCNEAITFNRKFRQHLMQRIHFETDRADELGGVLRESELLYDVYDAMRDVKSDFYYIFSRRKAMKNLIQLIGEENFHNQNYPPCVPTWYFNDMP